MVSESDLDGGIAAAGFAASSSASVVIRAARTLFDQAPYQKVTVEMVARSAGVNEVTIYRTFGSKDGLAAACWLGNLEALRRGIGRDRRETSDPMDRVRRHLTRLARISLKDKAITFALLQAVETQTIERGSKIGALDPRALIPLPLLLRPLVADAQEAGLLIDTYPSMELAAFLGNALLIRLMTRPDAPATETAKFVLDLAINGMATGARRSS